MSDPRLMRRLEEVSQRERRVNRLVFCAIGWSAAWWLFLAWKWLAAAPAPLWLPVAIFVGVIASSLGLFRRRKSSVQSAAIRLERKYPELDSRLLTALGQRPAESDPQYSYLQSQVLADVIDHARRHPWIEAVPTRQLWEWQIGQLVSLMFFIAAAIWASRGGGETAGATPPVASLMEGDAADEIVVEPGNIELERGRSLIVTARFPITPPGGAELVTIDPGGTEQRWPLSRSLDDPLFGGRIPEVHADLTYFVESAAGRSAEYRVTTFEYPALLRTDAIIVTPAYTGRGEQRIEDVRRVSVDQGSTLTLVSRFNKPLMSAELKPEAGDVLRFGPFTPLDETADDTDDVTAGVTWQPAASQTLTLVVADDAGRGLREPVELHIEVLPNRPPELTATFPSRDVQVSPLEELTLEASAWDDFGVQEYGVVVRTPEGDEQTIVLGNGAPSADVVEAKLTHLLSLEELGPAARDLLSYSFYADDLDADGTPRRTFGDVFFAEVRHFDEEYRELPGQPQSGDGGRGGGQQNPAQQLVDLQRQIVIASWNTIRTWPADRVVTDLARFRDETKVIAESQAAAQSQMAELAEQLNDAAAQQHAALADEHMTVAHEHLTMAHSEAGVAPLTPARNASQSAYQELLRLRDRLHVVQQQPGGGGGGGGQGLDRQLEQLELRNDRNRYEQERQAQDAQAGQNREQLQVLNRLRELSQRQADLNERIKELDDRRRTAQTDAEREELDRELKRLRDEQQELLRDADELRERMTQPQNQRPMADAREQLDQTRSDLQRASEALESGQSSRALTSGARAEQRLEEMKEEFRRRSAGAFDDAVRNLQQDARELADQQRAIGDELQQTQRPAGDARPSLRDSDRRAELGESLAQQQDRLSALLDQMRDVVEQSEQTEPLLSKHLYEAIREARVEQPDAALRMAEELLRRGFVTEGAAAEEQARRGVERLEAGVNRAADSILGDELQSLQRAQEQVADLARELENELAQAEPGASRRRSLSDDAEQSGMPREQPSENSDESSPGSDPSAGSQPQPTDAAQPGAEQPGRGEEGESPNGPPGEQSPSESPAPSGDQTGQQAGQGPTGDSSPSGNSPSQSDSRGGSGRSPAPRPDGQRGGQSLTDLFQAVGPEDAGGAGGGGSPLTGEDFSGWSDRLREVEEMLSVPELRSQAGAVRERARDVRREFKRHSKSPDWKLVRTEIYGPLLELQTRLAEEIARRRPMEDIVPIDRDPVPAQYTDLVREYYEQLSRARPQRDRAAAP